MNLFPRPVKIVREKPAADKPSGSVVVTLYT